MFCLGRWRLLRLRAVVRGALPDAAARAGVAGRAPRAPVPLRARAGAGAAQPAPRHATGEPNHQGTVSPLYNANID